MAAAAACEETLTLQLAAGLDVKARRMHDLLGALTGQGREPHGGGHAVGAALLEPMGRMRSASNAVLHTLLVIYLVKKYSFLMTDTWRVVSVR